jgi:hypothetical protein
MTCGHLCAGGFLINGASGAGRLDREMGGWAQEALTASQSVRGGALLRPTEAAGRALAPSTTL